MSAPNAHEVLVSEAVTQCLLRDGVRRVFGIPGGYFSSLFDAFARAGLRSVEGRHEGAAACMAAGYALTSGEVGVVYTQSGPGTTNAITGIVAGYMDSVPMLLLASQIPQEDYARDGHQESTGAMRCVDQLAIYNGVCAFLARPQAPEATVRALRVALASAHGHQAPAVLEIATNLLSSTVSFQDLLPSCFRSSSRPVDADGVERVAAMLREAKRPALILGNRIAHRGIGEDVRGIVEGLGIPFACVDYVKGILPEDHPFYLGVVGQSGHGSVAEFLQGSDLILTLGVRLTGTVTNRYQTSMFHHLVQIDDNPSEIGRCLPATFGVVGHLGATVRALRMAVARSSRASDEVSSEVLRLRTKHHVFNEEKARVDTSPLSTPRALRILREALPRETLIVSDTGLTAQLVKRHFPVYSEDGFYALYGLAPMGSGLPLSLGIAVAKRDVPIVSIIGDGGFLVHAGELNVAAQHGLPVIQVVVVNGGYKQVSDRLNAYYHRSYACDIPSVDYVKFAQSFGCDGYRARSGAELRGAVEEALLRKRPAVIELPVVGDNLMDIVPESIKELTQNLNPQRSSWPFAPLS